MHIGHPTRHAVSPAVLTSSEHPDQDEGAQYDRMLARQETQLREALAEIQALRRQNAEMTRQPEGGVVRALFAAREAAACRVATLTPREHEILDLVLAGRPNKTIAWELGISQRTVENHRAAIMHKTDSHSVPALTRLAIAAALSGIDAPPVQPVPTAAVAGTPRHVVHVDFRKR